MELFKSRRLNKLGKTITDKRGMTMTELLIVIAILGVLAAVVFISVLTYQRNMAQLERDTIAKEIFVAAQNHLTMAKGEGYSGASGDYLGTSESKKVYHYTVNEGTVSPAEATLMYNQMLPFGSIDETIRLGGSYIIRYQPDSGQVLDVFYCSGEGTRFGYNLSNLSNEAYNDLMSSEKYYGSEKKDDRKNKFNNGKSILGWYGGTDPSELQQLTLKAPTLTVNNAETLSVTIKDNNSNVKSEKNESVSFTGASGNNTDAGRYRIRLMLTGVSSKVEHYLDITESDMISGENGKFKILLDDVTNDGDHFAIKHFAEIVYNDEGIQTGTNTDVNKFIPGEDIKLTALAYSNAYLSNIAKSREKITNSLFEGVGDTDGDQYHKPDTAYISNFRHLENLDRAVSNLDANDTTLSQDDDKKATTDVLQIKSAIQTADLDWSTFLNKVGSDSMISYDSSVAEGLNTDTTYRPTSKTELGKYKPVDLNSGFIYEGKNHTVKNISVEVERKTESKTDPETQTTTDSVVTSGNAGMFGYVPSGSAILDLELIDFDINSKGGKAGAAVGVLSGTITNVLSRVTDNTKTGKIDSDKDKIVGSMVWGDIAGGLVGDLNNGAIQYCASAMIVKGGTTSGTAGGLVGSISGNGFVIGSFSGGHTKDGLYKDWLNETGADHTYDVTGQTAGGLIGSSSSGSSVSNCYSTCSVGGGQVMGGLVGSAAGSISKCYATGLIESKNIYTAGNMTENKDIGAFAGTCAEGMSLSDCKYLSIINEVKLEVTKNGNKEYSLDHYLGGVGDTNKNNITAIDENTSTYNNFVPDYADWKNANPYDNTLNNYYKNKYNFKTVQQLDAARPDGGWDNYFVTRHYGDWPAPEVFVINTTNNN